MTLFSLTPARLTDHRNPHGLVRVTCGGGLDTRPRFLSLVHESVEVSDDWRCGGVQSDEWFIGSFIGSLHGNASLGLPQDGDWRCEGLRSPALETFAENEERTWA